MPVARLACGGAVFNWRTALADSTIGEEESGGDVPSGGGVGRGTSRPNGIQRGLVARGRRWSPNEWAEISSMNPERREVTGAIVVAGLALTAVAIAGFAFATAIAEGLSARGGAVQLGGDQQAAMPGRPLFRQFCARCHGAQAQGTGAGPRLADLGLGREEIEMVVREGIPPLMPAFGKRLRTDQVQAVADYVASLSGGAGPGAARDQIAPPGKSRQPGGDQSMATSGRFVFRRQCAGCHGAQAEGRGAAPTLANVGLSREEVATAVREGIPPLMPAFARRLPPDQIQAVTDYVASLNPSASPSGFSGGAVAQGAARQAGRGRGFTGGMGCPRSMMGQRD